MSAKNQKKRSRPIATLVKLKRGVAFGLSTWVSILNQKSELSQLCTIFEGHIMRQKSYLSF
jgi:hypothetical protein